MKPKTLNELIEIAKDKLSIFLENDSEKHKKIIKDGFSRVYNLAIEDVRAMLMERVKELRQYKKVFIQTNQFTIEYGIQEIINELLRIAGKVKA